eukprot:4943340-Prymnesium_polylepis.2
MPPSKTRRIPCQNCGQTFKAGAGISMHFRLHCKAKPQSPTQDTKQGDQNLIEFDGNTTEIDEAVSLFRVWMRVKLVFSGRTKNANKCARILPIFQEFVANNASFFVDIFAYAPDRKAGARGSIFALFRDDILPAALRMEHVRSDVEGGLSINHSNTRLMKRVRRNNGQ